MARPTRAIEARRLKVTPELLANIRHRYEHTDEPLSLMAADLGCCGETVRNIAKREGWVRFVPPPRDLTPAARLAARAAALTEQSDAAVSLPPPIAERIGGGEENAVPPAQNDTVPASAQPPQVADTAVQLHHELQGLLVEVRATRERMKRESYGKHDLREISQVIANLTTTLRTLQPLLCPASQAGTDDDDYDDIPADLDAFRDALARRIETFLASRPDEGVAEDAAGDPVDDTRS